MELVLPLIPMVDGLSLFPKKCKDILKDISMFQVENI